jgi:hypothetical protein
MRLARKLGLVLFALGAAAWVWRSSGARSRVQQLFGDAGIWRTFPLDGASQAPGSGDSPGVLDLADENLTVTQRVRTNLGHSPVLADLPHLNINTEGDGIVYLRGYVHSEEQRRVVTAVAANTTGVAQVVDELTIGQAVNL